MPNPLLLINIAGLGYQAIGPATPHLQRLAERGTRSALQPPVPALTSPSQATILTGTLPAQHGIVGNGWYFPELALILNWQRSARLISGEPIWEALREAVPGTKVANLFWRYATHASCDASLTERPAYWADGRKSPDIYAKPVELRHDLVQRLGPFPLFRFWGPATDISSTKWIADATLHMMADRQFGFVLTYLPHLDYDHQRFGPATNQGRQALRDLDGQAGRLIEAGLGQDWDVAVVSDYAFEPVSQPIYLNRVLRQAGLVAVQLAENGELLEPGDSRAFAVCDQQIAHIYVNEPAVLDQVKQLVESTDGVGRVLDRSQMRQLGIDHPRSGQLLAIAEEDCWFAYPYWLEKSRAPDLAGCVAIHAKPGFDPAELFWKPGVRGKLHLAKRLLQKQLGLRAPFDVISMDAGMVQGSHGRIPLDDAQRPTLITSWQRNDRDLIPSHEVKSVLVRRFVDA